MFTFVSQNQEFGDYFADVLKDEAGDTYLAVHVDFPDGMGVVTHVFVVYIGNLPDFVASGKDLGAMTNASYRAFTLPKFCQWVSYNVAS